MPGEYPVGTELCITRAADAHRADVHDIESSVTASLGMDAQNPNPFTPNLESLKDPGLPDIYILRLGRREEAPTL